MSRAKRFLPKWFLSEIAGPSRTPHHGQGKDHELLWQTRRRDPKCNSGGRFAAATVMTTTFIPTRSGDGTFVLEFVPFEYTLFVFFFGPYPRVILNARLTLWPSEVYDLAAWFEAETTQTRSERQIRLVLLIRHDSMELPAEGLHNYYRS